MLFSRSKIPFYMKAATATVIMAGLPAWPPEPPPDALFELFCWQPSCRCCGGSSCPSPPPPPCCCCCCCWPTGSRTMARMIRLKVITYTGASTALLVTTWSEINATPRGQRFMPRGQRLMPRGQQFIPRGQRIMPRGQRLMPRGQRLMPRGQRLMRSV